MSMFSPQELDRLARMPTVGLAEDLERLLGGLEDFSRQFDQRLRFPEVQREMEAARDLVDSARLQLLQGLSNIGRL